VTDRTRRPHGRRIQAAATRVVNAPMRLALGLPFPTPLNRRLMLIVVTGRSTGKHYRLPVSFVRHEGALLTPGGGRWTRNLTDGSPTPIRLSGRELIARPELVRDIDSVDALLEVIVAANPMAGRFVAIPRDARGRFDRARLTTAIEHGFVIVRWRVGVGVPAPTLPSPR